MNDHVADAERLIPYLYTLDARAAGSHLVALKAAAVNPLIAVLDGSYPLPDLRRLDLTEIACVAVGTADSDAARERAAYLLGDIGDPRAVDALIAAFARETDRYIRLAVVRALGKIGDPRAIEPLIAALALPAWTPDYCLLVDDLARIGGERAVEPLIRVMQSTSYSYGSGARAARILTPRHADPRVLDGLIGALRLDAEFATLQAVIAALVESKTARGVQALLIFVGAMIALPPERWDQREDNLSETDSGVNFHILKTEFQQ